MSEWLRSWTRNPMGSARRGSNPLGVVLRTVYVLSGFVTGLQFVAGSWLSGLSCTSALLGAWAFDEGPRGDDAT